MLPTEMAANLFGGPPPLLTQQYAIPTSSNTTYGNTINVQCCMGPPMVNSDGSAYVEYEVRNVVDNVITSDTLYLYQIAPDDVTTNTITLSTTTQNQALLPGPIVPDGQGGVLATWTISPFEPPVPQYPYQAVDVVSGVVGTPYNLPFSPTKVAFGQSPTIVLGENGVAFASGQTTAGCSTHSRSWRMSGPPRTRGTLAPISSPNVSTGRALISVGHS